MSPTPGGSHDSGDPDRPCSPAAGIAQVGPPLDLYERPENEFVAQFNRFSRDESS